MAIRSFLAFELPPDIKEILSRVSEEMRGFPVDVRWVPTDNIHLTMVFLGNIPEDNITRIEQSVSNVCKEAGAFSVRLSGVGVFPNRRRPSVLWAGLDGEIERMGELRDALQKALAPLGIKEETRGFAPHLTLGRFKKGPPRREQVERLLSEYESLSSPVCTMDKLKLFRSQLRPGGAVYTELKTWSLAD